MVTRDDIHEGASERIPDPRAALFKTTIAHPLRALNHAGAEPEFRLRIQLGPAPNFFASLGYDPLLNGISHHRIESELSLGCPGFGLYSLAGAVGAVMLSALPAYPNV